MTKRYYEYFKSLGFNYCNYNLVNKKYLSFSDEDFYHTDHLSYSGATKFAHFIAQYDGTNLDMYDSKYFYTPKDYLDSINWVDACCFDHINGANKIELQFRALHGTSVNPLYKLVVVHGDSETVIQDFCPNSCLTISHTKLRHMHAQKLKLYAKADSGKTEIVRSYEWRVQ
ncbi:MAG: hypothetical protein BKP49_10590 [Treponema sp. CETP13]|nr:MAG: hypothetical protein BKP49_10590 [Treponema sp. CETP13]